MTMLEQTPEPVKKYFGDPKVAYAGSWITRAGSIMGLLFLLDQCNASLERKKKKPSQSKINWASPGLIAWRCPTFTQESALSSALSRFTVLFGMGRSGTNLLWSSGITVWRTVQRTIHRIHRANQLLFSKLHTVCTARLLNASIYLSWHNILEVTVTKIKFS